MHIVASKSEFNSTWKCAKCSVAGVIHVAEGLALFFGGIGGVIGNVIVHVGVGVAKIGTEITKAMRDKKQRKQIVRS